MNNQPSQNFWLTGRGLVAATGIGFLLYFLVIEHGEHLFPYLPYLILLLCPFMHFFMHGSHSHGDEKPSGDQYMKGYEDGLKKRPVDEGDRNA